MNSGAEANSVTAVSADVSGAANERPPLDDLMLAMDVVDTLRRRERLVARELDELGRAEDLKQRLKRIYSQQGLDVPDHVIEQGVAALREDRFTYKPPTGGLGRRLALIYIGRRSWGKWLGGGLAALVAAAAIYWFALLAPGRALPDDIEQAYEAATAVIVSEPARGRLEGLHNRAQAALADQDPDGASVALESLLSLDRRLRVEYTLQIV